MIRLNSFDNDDDDDDDDDDGDELFLWNVRLNTLGLISSQNHFHRFSPLQIFDT